MITNDATLLKIKHEVLYEVAKLAYAGRLEDERDDLPYKMVPGPQPAFRCCIYREREVIRQRIRLAEGKAPGVEDDGNIVQVINSACEGCPISRFVVTDNCQKCMGKACQSACRFGAISMGRDKSYIDPSKCKECGQCAKACPYNAIADLVRPCMKSCPVDAISVADNGTGIAVIDKDKCIQCGSCIHKCPFGAIGSKTFIVDIIKKMRSDLKVFAMMAPATIGQFGADITMASWRTALKKIGFYDVVDVGLGADMTAMSEAKEWLEAKENGKKKTTSCCPAFKKYIEKHFPELKDLISETVSPMCAVSRYIKKKYPGAVTVFIGPCIAKKSESLSGEKDTADYALTYGEIRAMLRAKGVKLEPEEDTDDQSSIYGKKFANAGGVTAAVLESMKELGCTEDVSVCKCSGIAECKKALTLLKVGRLPEDFIEGMACEGGCVGGPSRHRAPNVAMRDRNEALSKSTDISIMDNLDKQEAAAVDMVR
jgi:hypothetical protein